MKIYNCIESNLHTYQLDVNIAFSKEKANC